MKTFKALLLLVSIFNLIACQQIEILNRLDVKDEPYFYDAWHFVYDETYAQNNIDKNAHINIEDAWKVTRGFGVVVAVIDAGGFEIDHEDLKSNIIDTYNVDNKSNNIKIKTDDLQINNHGLKVAGLIASPVNGKGLLGVAPESKLILIHLSKMDDVSIIKAFKYAKDGGAKVINCSWGTNNVSPIVANYLQELKDYGISIVFASGNDGKNLDRKYYTDESELPSVIGVGASNELNDFALYSNYGKNIDILAPGGQTIGLLTLLEDNSYSYSKGTSLATPIVTGVIALMLSVNPSLIPDQIRQILIQSADKIGKNANYINGFDTHRAYGKVNATNALKLLLKSRKIESKSKKSN